MRRIFFESASSVEIKKIKTPMAHGFIESISPVTTITGKVSLSREFMLAGSLMFSGASEGAHALESLFYKSAPAGVNVLSSLN